MEMDPEIAQERMAKERTMLSNERTLLAYIRTGLSAFLLGFGMIKLFDGFNFFFYLGWVSVAAGIFFIGWGLKKHVKEIRRIRRMH